MPRPFSILSSKTWTVVSLALLPVVAMYAVLLREMRSVPMFDDYCAIIGFVLNLKTLPTIGSRLLYIVSAQHNEYKLIVEHIFVAADWALTGRIHFGFLIFVSDIFLLALLRIWWNNSFTQGTSFVRRVVLFLPVSYLLFQLNYVENLDWAMCGLQTLPTVVFSLAALAFLCRRPKPNIIAAGICCVLGCFSSANGFLMAVVGFWFLASHRRWNDIGVWTSCHAFAAWVYSYRYVVFVAPGTVENVKFMYKIPFFLQFVGSAAENMHHIPVRNGSMVVAVLILAVLAFAWTMNCHETNPFAFFSAIWCLLTAAVVTQGRIGQGLDLSLTLRYKLYSDLLLISCYVIVAGLVEKSNMSPRRRRILYSGALVIILSSTFVSNIYGYKFLVKREQRVRYGMDLFAADPSHNSPMVSITGEPSAPGPPEVSRRLLNQAITEGIYTLPAEPKR